MTKRASGTFAGKLTPQRTKEAGLDRMIIDKKFQGDLEASSKGQMLAAMTDIEGSAGYVAIELVTGILHGRRGSFALQHNGIMDRGKQQLSVIVVPDSGTEELTGLTGKMAIDITDGQQSYKFEYSLAEE